MNEEIIELITRRRRQVLVHSCIYYKFDMNIISDHQFDRWCNELVKLHKQYPNESKAALEGEGFDKFDGSSGYDLPFNKPHIVAKALQLINYRRR